MTRFLYQMELFSQAESRWYTLDGECEAQCVKEADATLRTLANAIIDGAPHMQFTNAAWVKRPWLKVVENV